MRLGWILLTTLLLWVGQGPAVLAAQLAIVDIDSAPVLDAPREAANSIATVPKGARLAVSNLPVEGFYKVRTETGLVGWISSQNIILANQDDEQSVELPGGRDLNPQFNTEKYLNIKLFGGLSLFEPTDVTTLTGVDGLGSGIHFGMSFNILMSDYIHLLMRAEYVTKSRAAEDTGSGNTFQFEIQSIPLMGGLGLNFALSPSSFMTLAGYAGYAFATSLSSTVQGLTANNVTSISAETLTFLGTATFSFQVSRSLGFFIEGGYRYLITDALTPTQSLATTSGADLFAESGSYVPVVLDLSGVTISGGVSVSF